MLPILTLLILLSPSGQAEPPAAGELMARLSQLELSAEDTHQVRNLTLRRDVISVSLTRGVLAFLEPVDGRVTGAVFLGSGEVLGVPPDDIERRQLDRFTGSPILNERFDAAFLRFTDDTYEELRARLDSSPLGPVRAADLEALLPFGQNLGDRSRLLNFRLFRDLIGTSDRPIFFAALRGETLGWFEVTYDQRSTEEVAVTSRSPSGEGKPAVWMSFNERSESGDPALYGSEPDADFDVLRYDIETTIEADGTIRAVAGVAIAPVRGGERVVGFSLAPSLVVADVRLGGVSVPWFRHSGAEPSLPGAERLLVVLPRPFAVGEEIRLEFSYSGPVLVRRGDGVYYVSERVFWYPHAGVLDPARYRMSFHYPPDNVLVATGEPDAESEDSAGHSTWTTDGEIVVAGFNYGDFSVESAETGPVPIYVHLNNDVETVFEEISEGRAASTERALEELASLWVWRRRSPPPLRQAVILPDYDLFSTRRLAANLVGQVQSIVESFTRRLGEFPFGRLSVSQFPVPFSQGWPSLLYVSTYSFFDAEQRDRLRLAGVPGAGDAGPLVESVLAHEIAHQWFGNTVSWRSYRDQWIAEGFANYLAVMYVEERNPERARAILANLARDLFRTDASGRAYETLGPLWLGQRLNGPRTPGGYEAVVYPKATWVVHMLRMMMRDPSPSAVDPDARFTAMLREFLGRFGGGPATTWDLRNVARRHMTRKMDLAGDDTLDWFFDQWVFSTGVPEFVMEAAVVPDGSAFSVRGSIDELNGLGFYGILPVYARDGDGEPRLLGEVAVTGEAARFDFPVSERPGEILMDPYRTVLRR